MLDPKILDDLARTLQSELERNFRSTPQGASSRMELVTREEFDVQTEVLAAKVAELEANVPGYEQGMDDG